MKKKIIIKFSDVFLNENFIIPKIFTEKIKNEKSKKKNKNR